ncbi:WhiB family transcriptional regulator [Yinghuangia sp. ASG 101]|uniref:WhiB family transcriptional regulator n=1 Tax=Yinghuangia sp. ASG 101 TaxID=2896848 RepID=UPI001E5C4FE4|nr:WhiB family transcriptional regulator [Yinghuangia sp. ASG 101]UGQ10968.1 WhiB family transcriptional regulator [Yinghuangia sp. ASG 101]
MRPEATYPRLGMSGWRDRAACATADPKIFDAKAATAAQRAKAWCRVCPVTAECLASALVCEDTHGVRGGLTHLERRPLHKATAARLDIGRVQAALDGHDIHLNKREMAALEDAALEQLLPIPRLAWLLKTSTDLAEKLHARRHGHDDESTDEPDHEPADMFDPGVEHPADRPQPGNTHPEPIRTTSQEPVLLRRDTVGYDRSEAAA